MLDFLFTFFYVACWVGQDFYELLRDKNRLVSLANESTEMLVTVGLQPSFELIVGRVIG